MFISSVKDCFVFKALPIYSLTHSKFLFLSRISLIFSRSSLSPSWGAGVGGQFPHHRVLANGLGLTREQCPGGCSPGKGSRHRQDSLLGRTLDSCSCREGQWHRRDGAGCPGCCGLEPGQTFTGASIPCLHCTSLPQGPETRCDHIVTLRDGVFEVCWELGFDSQGVCGLK